MKTAEQFPSIALGEEVTPETFHLFRQIIYRHYQAHPRPLPWRETENPYHILVSEIMLQQTRVERVVDKYHRFLAAFPDFPALARAPLCEVLAAWQGLGYNRRAISLKQAANRVVDHFRGLLPASPEELRTLPGVGPYTASAVCVFAFHRALPLIETNIRSVFIHFFFREREGVKDREILPLITATLDAGNPREWYYALMDYGVMLKRTQENPSRRSAHHAVQSPFEGSDRQIRGKILKYLIHGRHATTGALVPLLGVDEKRLKTILDQMEQEGFLLQKGHQYEIPE